jgi:hypothetical protein
MTSNMNRSQDYHKPLKGMGFAHLSLVLLCTISAVLLGGCGGPVSENKLIGSWQLTLGGPSGPPGPVFTYNSDHTMTMTLPNPGVFQNQAMLGVWKLEGSILTTTIGSMTNNYGASPTGSVPANVEKVSITKLTDSVMVWKGSVLSSSATLRRKSPPPGLASAPNGSKNAN